MSYAVVKFLNETETDDEEVVSEVPTSWLSENKDFCKWPPDRFASFYISKNFPAEDNWKKYPIEVECFCDSLAEAKQKTKGNSTSDVGRGCRKIIPKDYFSPGEEEERYKERKRATVLKKIIPAPNSDGYEYFHKEFMEYLNKDKEANDPDIRDTVEENTAIIDTIEQHNADSRDGIEQHNAERRDSFEQNRAEVRDIQQNDIKESSEPPEPAVPSKTIEIFSLCDNIDGGSSGSFSGISTGGTSTSTVNGFVVPETDIASLNKKLETVVCLLRQVKIDLVDIKQRLDITEKPLHEFEEELPVKFPLKSLTELEDLENIIKENLAQKRTIIKILKNIGGNDCKDYVTRICKHFFTNALAETCSWTGRKNNFCLGNLDIIKVMYGIVHQKTKATQKQFEQALSEWLRHAKQRREREEKNRNTFDLQ